MAYAGKHALRAAGYAVWQIFPPDDTDCIRQYLREHYLRINDVAGDPIHNQAIYLTQEMLSELAAEYDTRPYGVYQRVGEAVFIPAGSPHQIDFTSSHPSGVSNQANCIKVACDFVSPESAATCQLLANEFRAQRLAVEHFPDEVLPVNVMLLVTAE
ncbi:hypothetical protein LXA43DRAFT_885626 [Ganoderma leucocontextum]|nr:hypothetical protein LXA43DRAFT_885626 [Ganoderma leucocontextum]